MVKSTTLPFETSLNKNTFMPLQIKNDMDVKKGDFISNSNRMIIKFVIPVQLY